MFTALGIDPGGTTGWAAVHVREIAMLNHRDLISGLEFEYGQITGNYNYQATEIMALIDEFQCPVAMENFALRQRNVELSPLVIASKVEYGMYITGRMKQYHLQNPGDAKGTINDKRMKEWGIWLPHKERHARDGIRHALLFLRRAQADHKLFERAYGRKWNGK